MVSCPLATHVMAVMRMRLGIGCRRQNRPKVRVFAKRFLEALLAACATSQNSLSVKPVPGLRICENFGSKLAATTGDCEADRANLKRELKDFGHLLLPDKSLPLRVPELEQTVTDSLAQSRVFVYLMDSRYGLLPEWENERSVVCLQQELPEARGAELVQV